MKARQPTAAAGRFKRAEQTHGINFDVDALPFDDALRVVYKPISCLYWDWLHVLAASGGVAQFIINAVALDVEREGIQLDALDRLLAVYMHDNRARLGAIVSHPPLPVDMPPAEKAIQ